MSFVDIAIAVGGVIAEGAAAVSEGAAAAGAALGEGAGAVGSAIGSGIGAIGEGLGSAVEGIGGLFGEGASAAEGTAAPVVSSVPGGGVGVGGVGTGGSGLTAAGNVGGAGINTLASSVPEELGTTLQPAFEDEVEEVGEQALRDPSLTKGTPVPQSSPMPSYSGAPQASPVPQSNFITNLANTTPTPNYDATSVGAQYGQGAGNVGSQTAQTAAKAPSFFEEYKTPIMLGGLGLLGSTLFAKPSQANAPVQNWNPWGNYYNFNPRYYAPSQPTYVGKRYADGGITSLASSDPAPGMMASGNPKLDFMGQDAFPTSQQKLNFYNTPSQMPTSAQQAMASYEPATNPLTGEPLAHFAKGGISDLGAYSDGGRLTRGPGDGMSDDIPANIAGKQQARLAQGEFVVPADVVSHLGNGSTDAGAKQLYSMMDRVRKARTGRKSQGKQINARRQMPV